MNANPITISVVIPTRNNIPQLSQALNSMLNSAQATGVKHEFIISTNGSDSERQVTVGYVNGLKQALGKVPYATINVVSSKTEWFAAAVNAGLKYAKGDYVVIVNDDVIVPKAWLINMVKTFQFVRTTHPDVRWGYTGPMSNYAMGTQNIQNGEVCPQATNPDAVEDTITRLMKHPAVPAFQTMGTISGFCLMVTKECLAVVGGMDGTIGTGGFEDNDWCIRAQEAGYHGFISCTSFVFHWGGTVMKHLVPDYQSGCKHIVPYLSKWAKSEPKKLVAGYCVKIDREEDFALWKESIDAIYPYVDQIVVVDDRSSLNIDDFVYVHGYEDKMQKANRWRNADEDERDEPRDRNKCLELARNLNPDWIWVLDHDEVVEGLTEEKLSKLLNPIDPQTQAYVMPMAHFWRDRENIRVDGIFGNLAHLGLFRNVDGLGNVRPLGKSKFHSRRGPNMAPPDGTKWTFSVTVRHYGYDNWEKTKRKQKFYQENDKVKDQKLIGTPNYEHLTWEMDLKLLPYERRKTSTLLYLAKNEVWWVANRVRQYRDMFDEFIVVDTGSTDGLEEFCAKAGVKRIEYKCCEQAEDPDHMICNFSAARNFAIEQCTTDYILFMDPDEEFIMESLLKFDKFLLSDADALIVHIKNHHVKLGKRTIYMTHQPRLFKNRPELRYDIDPHETLETALKENNFNTIETTIECDHYGFLRTSPEERKRRNDAYADKMRRAIEANPTDYRSLFGLGIHENENGNTTLGDTLLAQSLEVNPNFFTARWELALRLSRQALDLLLQTPPGKVPRDERGEFAQKFVNDLRKWHPDAGAPRP